MKRTMIAVIAFLLVAGSACAASWSWTGPGAPGRFIFLTTPLSAAEAATQVAFGQSEPMIRTGSKVVPYVSWTIFYCLSQSYCDASGCHAVECSIAAPPPPPIPVYWMEISSQDFFARRPCAPAILHPTPFRDDADCARWYYDHEFKQFRFNNMVKSSEGSWLMFGFND